MRVTRALREEAIELLLWSADTLPLYQAGLVPEFGVGCVDKPAYDLAWKAYMAVSIPVSDEHTEKLEAAQRLREGWTP